MREIKISEVIIENRIRHNYGFIDSLERSIQQVGVLQPIGIDRNNRLIFGGRRLQAAQNVGLDTIPCRVFDLDANDPIHALRMEREENEHRLDLTPSEKVEIAMRIEDACAGRQGKRTDLELPQDFVEVKSIKERETSSIAAKAVDMNRETYRQAKAVVESGKQEVIQAMDSGEKSINAAYREVRRVTVPKTFKVTLYKNPQDDAEVLMMKAGAEYCTKLGLALLKTAGHRVEG